jgi:hypothetical protein
MTVCIWGLSEAIFAKSVLIQSAKPQRESQTGLIVGQLDADVMERCNCSN